MTRIACLCSILGWALHMTTTTAAPAAAAENDLARLESGAALLWSSSEPLHEKARELILRGELQKAEGLLAGDEDALEIVRRIRQDYSLDETPAIEKLKPAIRDLSPDDLRKWAEAGQIQCRRLDGEVRYFRREPSNLFRFCPEAIGRRIKAPSTSGGFELKEHLAQVIAAARDDQTFVAPIRHRVQFTVTVSPGVRGYKTGSLVRAWLPFPQEYGHQQTDVKLISADPANPQITPNAAIHRSLYFEQRIGNPTKPIRVQAVYEFTSRAYCPRPEDSQVQPLPADVPRHFLAERPPHIRFSPELKAMVAKIIGDSTNPLAKARRIFHWVDANIRYNAEEEYCIIPSFSQHGLERRRGDCGIQATLFITMCRAAGIPARFQSGWQTKPNGDHNMHDWVEIYIAPWGWLPCDPSYGLQKGDDPAVREFYFGHQDSYRMIVNLDYGGVLWPTKRSLRSEPADFQRGEVELDGRNLYFDEFDYDFEVTHLAP
jgi:transglutaminase-like putative cysteine protease